MTRGIGPQDNDSYELIQGDWASAVAEGQNFTVQTIAAHAGGTQTPATQINPTACLIAVKTVASAGDSCKLPAAKAGAMKMVINETATSTNIFGYNATDTINGTLGSTAFACAGNKSALFFCPVDGVWGAIGGS